MSTLRRYLYGEIIRAVGFVLLAFLSLFVFFDLVEELNDIGRSASATPELTYALHHVILYLGLQIPTRVYELLPMAVLIGTVWVLARLANNSEFTILRTSGLGPWRALKMLLGLGAAYVLITFSIGDYLAPWAGQQAQLLKAQFEGRISQGATGVWLKERQGDRHFSINVGAMNPDRSLKNIRIFEFTNEGAMVVTMRAARGAIQGKGWTLSDVQKREFQAGRLQNNTNPLIVSQVQQLEWPTEITAEMIAVALLQPERMRTVDLFGYIQHLNNNEQSAQRYEIEFWRKVFYPLSCLVMVVLALPFAYLHTRSGGVAGYVFIGVMIGISFFLLNNMFGFIGNLRQWTPWFAAGLPSMIYSVLSLSAFGWLVLRR
jgi:lipopolysaccharide export system permease protein